MTSDDRFSGPPVDPDTDRDPADQPQDEVKDGDLTPYRELAETDREGEEWTEGDPRADDPDLQAAQETTQDPDDPGNLDTDELAPSRDDRDGWEPPDREPTLEQGQTLDERLAAEVPEQDPTAGGRRDAQQDLLES